MTTTLAPTAPRAQPDLLRLSVVVPLLLVVLAGGLRLFGLSTPKGTYWDENYYAMDAYGYLGGMLPNPGLHLPPVPTIHAETSWGHPPLGKWIIAAGVGPSGFSDVGSRLPSALFGVAAILLVYLIGMELWGSVLWAGLAGLLVTVDGLHIVQSRIATLDIFMSTFVLAGAYFVLRDRRQIRAGSHDARDRLWAGAMFGCAVAVKWNGAWALAFAAVLTAVWLRGRDRRSLLLAYVALPVAIYLVSYTQFFVQHPFDLVGWVRLQVEMLRNNVGSHLVPATSSPAWTWPFLLHPIRYWTATGGPARGTILALGNPVLFWGFLASLPLAVQRVIRRRDRELGIVLGFYAVMFVPWLAASRTEYFYYILPCVPFMALTIAGTLRTLSPQWSRRLGVTVGALALLVAAAFAPVWLGLPTSSAWLAHLRWLPRWH
jgi:dolichyl-phosphate-mannose--protein O-mannosyl transferase